MNLPPVFYHGVTSEGSRGFQPSENEVLGVVLAGGFRIGSEDGWIAGEDACGDAVGDGFVATEFVREDGKSAQKTILTVLDVLMRGLTRMMFSLEAFFESGMDWTSKALHIVREVASMPDSWKNWFYGEKRYEAGKVFGC